MWFGNLKKIGGLLFIARYCWCSQESYKKHACYNIKITVYKKIYTTASILYITNYQLPGTLENLSQKNSYISGETQNFLQLHLQKYWFSRERFSKHFGQQYTIRLGDYILFLIHHDHVRLYNAILGQLIHIPWWCSEPCAHICY